MRSSSGFLLPFLCLPGAFPLEAQEFMPPLTNPPAADYEPQGEYVGAVPGSGARLGAWVVARGGSHFDVVLLPGGLLDLGKAAGRRGDPDYGWDGHARYSATGIALSGTNFNAALTGGGTTYQLDSITGTGSARVLNGTAGASAFALVRKTGEHGIGGERHSPTLGLRPEGKFGSTGFRSLFVDGNKATTEAATADLAKWKRRDNDVQLKYGNFLYRGVQSVASHGTCFLHIEARTAFTPTATGQKRGNSGIFLRGMHEQQDLDSFGSNGMPDDMGAVCNVKVPAVNAALRRRSMRYVRVG